MPVSFWDETKGSHPQQSSSGSTCIAVSEAVKRASDSMQQLGTLEILGEISAFKGPQGVRGHCYFTLKDAHSSLTIALWNGRYKALAFPLEDGLQVKITGNFSVYEKNAQLSFIAQNIELFGEGKLRQIIEQRYRDLLAQGLFAPEKKQAIPRCAEYICVVTSTTGAVQGDVKKTILQNNPLARIEVVGCAVQGVDAPATIIKALQEAEARHPDVILLVRGGGSLEDLMAYNDEAVVRAVAATSIPVVSGIGHEPDVSLVDHAADVAAVTPTAAAAYVAPNMAELLNRFHQMLVSIHQNLTARLSQSKLQLDTRIARAGYAAKQQISQLSLTVSSLGARPVLQDQSAYVQAQSDSLEFSFSRLERALQEQMRTLASMLAQQQYHLAGMHKTLLNPFKATLISDKTSLFALSPQNVLKRGYAIVRAKGHVLSSVDAVKTEEQVEIALQDGKLTTIVQGIKRDATKEKE